VADPYRRTPSVPPAPPLPLSLELFPVHAALRPGTETPTHLLMRVRARPDPTPRARPQLSAVLVLDVSGSMMGDPIAHVMQSAQRLTEILGETDRLGVVTFNEGAATIAPLRRLDRDGRRDLRREIASIRAGGGTNIGGALAHAAVLLPPRAPNERQMLLLLSDGEPNVGAQDPASLGEQARLVKQREVAVSTLGYGASHNDDILVAIAEGGGGRYAFVVDPKVAESSFVRTLGAQLDVVAEQVRLTLAPSEGVEILRVLDDPPTAFGTGGLRITLPDLILGDELNVVVELKLRPGREVGEWRPLRVTLSGQRAGGGSTFTEELDARVTITDSGPLSPNVTAYAAVSVARAAEMRAEARRHADRGGYGEAAAILRRAQAMLEGTPGFVAGGEGALADAFEALADELTVLNEAPRSEDYQRFKKAARDYLDFAHSGAKPRGGGQQAPPSAKALLDRALAGVSLPRAYLRMLDGAEAGRRYPIGKDRFVIGRARQSSDMCIASPQLSRQSAMVEFHGDAFWLVDMGSTNGPTVAGSRVSRWRLKRDDVFELGGVTIRYEED
jgi:Ca-activated chloride channel homolog